MTNLLSIITFLPIVAAAILALFLRGEQALQSATQVGSTPSGR